MKPGRCSFCKGKLIEGKSEFVVKVDEEILVIKNVSAYICNECGEAYYSTKESEKIDILMKKFHKSDLLVHPLAAGELKGMRRGTKIITIFAYFCLFQHAF